MMRIVVLAPGRPSWVEADIEILKQFASVRFVDVLGRRYLLALFSDLYQIMRSDICYFWFGSLRHIPYLIVAKMMFKKIAIVAGGYDVARFDQIGYGAFGRSEPKINCVDCYSALRMLFCQSLLSAELKH
ncbi:MAG: hypothetical protein HC902_02570 [Calothrix sp. SM1_5_4]|nr:hypothetical protein [Calothrix sp. SM1_5_4]